MMQPTQSQVPQELSALMALQQGMQTGQVSPVTSSGQPTVAAQMAGAAQQQLSSQMAPQAPMGSPAVNQVARQAGIAGQIQAMQQQKMQQALMQQAMAAQQQQQAAGIEGLNPNVRGFKSGGIVGYAGDDDSVTVDPGSEAGGASDDAWYKRFLRKHPSQEPPLERRAVQTLLETVGRNVPASSRLGQLLGKDVQVDITDIESLRQLLNDPRVPPADREAIRDALVSRYVEAEYLQPLTPVKTGAPDSQAVRRLSAEIPAADVPPPAAPPAPPPPSPPRARPGAGDIPIARVGLGSLPAAQRDEMGPSMPAPGERQFAEAFDAMRRAKEQAVRPQQVGTEATGMADEERQFIISRGGDPDLLKKAAEDVTRRAGERGGYYTQQAQDVLEKQQRRSLATYLMNARGSRLGETFASAANAANRAEELALAQSQRFMELKFQVQDAAAKDKLLLDKARDETMRGQFDKARKTLEEREKNRQTQERAEAELKMNYGKFLAGEEDKAQSRVLEQARIEAQMRGQDLQYLSSMQREGASNANNPAYIANMINDNVQKRYDAWSKSLEGIRASKDPTISAAKWREFQRDALNDAKALGVNVPPEAIEILNRGTTPGAAPGVNPSQWGELKTR